MFQVYLSDTKRDQNIYYLNKGWIYSDLPFYSDFIEIKIFGVRS